MSFRANNATKFARSMPMIECAQCGEQLFMPNGRNTLISAARGTFGNVTRAVTPLSLPFFLRRVALSLSKLEFLCGPPAPARAKRQPLFLAMWPPFHYGKLVDATAKVRVRIIGGSFNIRAEWG